MTLSQMTLSRTVYNLTLQICDGHDYLLWQMLCILEHSVECNTQSNDTQSNDTQSNDIKQYII
jgi:hypothetical protein